MREVASEEEGKYCLAGAFGECLRDLRKRVSGRLSRQSNVRRVRPRVAPDEKTIVRVLRCRRSNDKQKTLGRLYLVEWIRLFRALLV